MARKSRTAVNIEENVVATYKQHMYEAGLYRRLSVEADGDDEELHSIGNQQKIMEDYVEKQSFVHIKKVYTDNGVSGMTFKRDGFIEMMNDLYAGVINCIIVKDISRLGRHFILTSELVEKTLPSMNVRLISVLDNFDSIDPASDTDMLLMQIKMVINDNYCKDFSKKIRSSINAKMGAGEFLPSSGSIPYGYVRNPQENTFDIDEETAPIVKKIFELRSEGMCFNAIAKQLNDEGYPSPGRIRYDRGLTKCEKFEKAVWLRGAVRKICSDPVYTGCRIHGKVKRDRLGENKTRREQDEWQIIENAHKPIVTKELFDIVQQVNEGAIAKRENFNKRPAVKDDQREVLLDKVVCGDCGSKMTARKGLSRSRKTGEYSAYVFFDCNHYHKTGKKECKCHYIRQDAIMDSLHNCLNKQLKLAMDYEKFMVEVRSMPKVVAYNASAEASISSLRVKMTNVEAKKEQLIEDMISGLLDTSEYDFMNKRLDKQLSQLQHDYCETLNEKNKLEQLGTSTEGWIRSLKEYGAFRVIDRSLMEILVDKIFVYDNTHLQIKLNFADPFKDVYSYVDRIEEAMKDAV